MSRNENGREPRGRGGRAMLVVDIARQQIEPRAGVVMAATRKCVCVCALEFIDKFKVNSSVSDVKFKIGTVNSIT